VAWGLAQATIWFCAAATAAELSSESSDFFELASAFSTGGRTMGTALFLAGVAIGTTGSTGGSTGCTLHCAGGAGGAGNALGLAARKSGGLPLCAGGAGNARKLALAANMCSGSPLPQDEGVLVGVTGNLSTRVRERSRENDLFAFVTAGSIT
jgi:hypothetical protein